MTSKFANAVSRTWQIPLPLYQWLLVKSAKSGYGVNDFVVTHFENVQKIEADALEKKGG